MPFSGEQYKASFGDVFASSAKYLSVICMMFAMLLATLVAIVTIWGVAGLGFFDNAAVYETVKPYYGSVIPSLVSAVLASSLFGLVYVVSK